MLGSDAPGYDEANDQRWREYLQLLRNVRGGDEASAIAANDDIRFLFSMQPEVLMSRMQNEARWAGTSEHFDGGQIENVDEDEALPIPRRGSTPVDSQLELLRQAIDDDRSEDTTAWAVDGDSEEAIDYLIDHAGDSSAATLGLVNLAINAHLSQGQVRRIYELDLLAIGEGLEGFAMELTFEENVLMNIASNDATPADILQTLTKHENGEVAEYAREGLR
ncbi:hypothetical protein [Curtobacterium sp. PhB78]|uniref:hypothetical protein n=1 Tax=Curtobacterium sp. PhB78 TaxID=2485102 RepID=UPI000F46869E|nr:hypothetical protein [Curtobacterium sp. PhB78]ROS46998.1 hypothetical protein EDF53_0014 [Curtobacterium sp. PhB78]